MLDPEVVLVLPIWRAVDGVCGDLKKLAAVEWDVQARALRGERSELFSCIWSAFAAASTWRR